MSAALGTTPTFTLTFADENLDLTTAASVYVTFKYGCQTLTKTGADLEVQAKKIIVSFTQEETLSFPEGPMQIQANWTGTNGFRAASEIQVYKWSAQLLPEVL